MLGQPNRVRTQQDPAETCAVASDRLPTAFARLLPASDRVLAAFARLLPASDRVLAALARAARWLLTGNRNSL